MQKHIPRERYAGQVPTPFAIYRPANAFGALAFTPAELGVAMRDGEGTAVEITPEQLAAHPAVQALMQGSAEAALRAANLPDATARPGGNPGVPNVNLGRPQRLRLSSMIRAIGARSWTGFEAERDFAQGIQDLFLHDDHEQGVSVALPATRSAFLRAIAETKINVGQGAQNDVIRDWAVRTAEWEELALSRIIAGDYSGAQMAMRAAGESSTGAGGALVPPEFMQQYYTLSLQTATAFANAPGVTRIPVKSNLIYFPRETVMPTSNAYAEGAVITESDPTFGQQAITIKKQAALNQFSNELLADATPEYEGVIGKSLARSVGLKQDYQWLEGDGTGANVLGLGSYPGLTTGYTAGTNGDAWGQAYNSTGPVLPGTDFPLQLVAKARAAGWEPNAWMMHPDVMDLGLARVLDGNGRYLLESVGGVFGAPIPVPNIGALPTQITYVTPPWKAMLFGSPVFMSAQIPETETQGNKSDCTHVYVGDFNFAHILERQAIEMAVSDQIYFTTDQTAVRVSARSAIVLLAPGAFMKQSGVRAVTS